MSTDTTDTIANTTLWFEKAVPYPTPKSISVQMGCHFEEVAEMIDSIQAYDGNTNILLQEAQVALENLATHLKTKSEHVLLFPNTSEQLLDALCDQVVTATGVAHMLGYQFVAAMKATNESNWSKFVDGNPVFDENGKIRKGPRFFKADYSLFTPQPVN